MGFQTFAGNTDQPTLRTSIRVDGTATDTEIPSEKAIAAIVPKIQTLESGEATVQVINTDLCTEIFADTSGGEIGDQEVLADGTLQPVTGSLTTGATRVAIAYGAITADTPTHQKVKIFDAGANFDTTPLSVYVGDYTVAGQTIADKVLRLDTRSSNVSLVRNGTNLIVHNLPLATTTGSTDSSAALRATIAEIAANPDAVVLAAYQGQSNNHGRDAQNPAPFTYSQTQIYFKVNPASTADDGAFALLQHGVNLNNPIIRPEDDIYGPVQYFARNWELDAETQNIPLYLAGYHEDARGFRTNHFDVTGPLYERLTKYYLAPAIRDLLAQNKDIYILLLTDTGEADSQGPAGLAEYQVEYPQMVEGIRAMVGAADMPVFMSRLNNSLDTGQYPSGADVASFQRTYADGDPDIYWHTMNDVAMSPDNIHYLTAGYAESGLRKFNLAKSATISRVTAQPTLPNFTTANTLIQNQLAQYLFAGTAGDAFAGEDGFTDVAAGNFEIAADGNGLISQGGSTAFHILQRARPAMTQPILEIKASIRLGGDTTKYVGLITRYDSTTNYAGGVTRRSTANQFAAIHRTGGTFTFPQLSDSGGGLNQNSIVELTVQDNLTDEIRVSATVGGNTYSVDAAAVTDHAGASDIGLYCIGPNITIDDYVVSELSAFTL